MNALTASAPVPARGHASFRGEALPAQFDEWRRRMLATLLAMRRAGVPRELIEDEIAGTMNALRLLGEIDV